MRNYVEHQMYPSLFIYLFLNKHPYLGFYHLSVVEDKLFFLDQINFTLFISTWIYRNVLIRLETILKPLLILRIKKIEEENSWLFERSVSYCSVFIAIRFLSLSRLNLLKATFTSFFSFLAAPIKSVIPSAISMWNDFFCRTNPLCVNNLLAPSSLQALCWKKYST